MARIAKSLAKIDEEKNRFMIGSGGNVLIVSRIITRFCWLDRRSENLNRESRLAVTFGKECRHTWVGRG